MSELGWGAGGISEALQLMQALQSGKLENQQKQVALETSQMQLENLKKLQSSLGGQAFQNAIGSGDPQAQNKAMMDLADTYLSSNMPQQAKAVTDMAMNIATSKAYSAEQQAAASQKYITMAEDLFSGVNNAQEWAAAQTYMQSILPPEAMQNPTVKGLLTSGYSPDKIKILPQFFERLKAKAQTAAEQARAGADEARTRYYSFEERKDQAEADAAEARASFYNREGGNALLPSKQEIDAVANDLQAKYPEAEADPVVQGGKVTNTAAVRSNYKARIQARATDIAEAAKAYIRQGIAPAEARRRAIEEADSRGDLTSLKPVSPQRPAAPAASPATPGLDAWGEPSVSK